MNTTWAVLKIKGLFSGFNFTTDSALETFITLKNPLIFITHNFSFVNLKLNHTITIFLLLTSLLKNIDIVRRSSFLVTPEISRATIITL